MACTETSVKNYHYSLRNNPEERRSQLFRGGCPKSSPRYFAVGVRRLSHSVQWPRAGPARNPGSIRGTYK